MKEFKNIVEKKIFIIPSFIVTSIIIFLSMLLWTLAFYVKIIEGVFFEFSPSNIAARVLFLFFNTIFTIIIVGFAYYIFKKTKNVTLFWISYTIIAVAFFFITMF